MIIRDVIITPIAFRDPPLLNTVGVHEPLALRTIVQLVVDGGIIGLGEGSGGARILERLHTVKPAVVGKNVFDLGGLETAIMLALNGTKEPGVNHIDHRSVFAPIEVAAHDAQGKILGLPVATLLGGAVRDSVPYAGYLFYKWAGHPTQGSDETPAPDPWGAALDPQGIVEQARQIITHYGFKSLKLKAGVFPPDQEIAAMRALAEAFPGYPLRIDPNGAWSLATAERAARELSDVLEYLEDPVLAMDDMAKVHHATGLPLATNMCVVAFDHIAESVAKDAVQIILGDHHLWGGLRHTRELGAICETFGIGMSMHSNSHLGISLAAMTHVAAATPSLTYACDTHYPWNGQDDIVKPGALEIINGAIQVPTAPGLGVELDEERLAHQHKVFLESKRQERDDTSYMKQFDPSFDPQMPRF